MGLYKFMTNYKKQINSENQIVTQLVRKSPLQWRPKFHTMLKRASNYPFSKRRIIINTSWNVTRANVALGRCRTEEDCEVWTRSNYRQTALEFISIVARPHTNIYYSVSYPQRIFLQVRIMFSIYVGIKVSLATDQAAECKNGTRVSTAINTWVPPGDSHMSGLCGKVQKRKITTDSIHHQYRSTQFNPGITPALDLQWGQFCVTVFKTTESGTVWLMHCVT